MTEWQDIATAPRDGRPVLVWANEEAFPLVARWVSTGRGVGVAYWEPCEELIADVIGEIEHPLFWMPIPSPPKE